MARDNELRTRLTVDDQASNVIRKVGDEAKQLEEPVEITVEARIDKALGALDDVATDARKAKEAAEALGRALGPELAAKANLDGIVADFERANLSLDEITANADQLGGKLREIAGPDGAGLDQIGTRARAAAADTDKLSDSARGANSALANMVGNSAQELGELGGIAGSAGVAVGQMAEYFSDATLAGEGLGSALKSMVAVVGPIALLAAAVQTVSGALAIQERRAEEAAARTEAVGDAMRSAADDTVGLADKLRETADAMKRFEATDIIGNDVINRMNDLAASLPIIGGLAQDLRVDLAAALTKAGSSMYEFSRAIDGTTAEAQLFLDAMYAQMQAGKLTGREYTALTQAVVQYRKAASDAASTQALMNVNAEEANAVLAELVTKADPLARFADVWATLMQDMADGSIDTKAAADAVNELAEKLGLTQEEVIDLAREHLADQMSAIAEAASETAEAMGEVNDAFAGTGERVAALGRVLEAFNARTPLDFADMAADTVQSFDDLKAALEDVSDIGSRPLAPTTVEDLRGLSAESGRVIDAMGAMRSAIQTELGAALESAGGNFDGLREKAGFFRDEITTQFTDAFTKMGLGPDEVDAKVTELLGNLGLLPSQVETQIRLTQADEAMRKIELFGAAIDNLPPEVQTQVAAAIDANDPVKAWELIKAGVDAQGAVPVETTADPQGFTSAMGELEQGDYSTTVDVGADTKPAESDTEAFTRKRRETAPISVLVNQALAAAALLAFITQSRATTIYVGTSGVPEVSSTLNALATPRRVPIEAYVADYPTTAEIQRLIGRPRIPVDLVVGQTIRITGVRE